MKLLLPVNGRNMFISQLNSFLPSDIRVHCMTKVTGGFNAKSACSGRKYHYLLPTYMLQSAADVNALLLQQHQEQQFIALAGSSSSSSSIGESKLNEKSMRAVRQKLVAFRVGATQLELLRSTLKLYEGDQHYYYTVIAVLYSTMMYASI